MRQPLPIECRDTVTGHAFANGCVDELTWYLEDKSIWAAAMAMTLAMLHVITKKKFKLFSETIFFLYFLGHKCRFVNHSHAGAKERRGNNVSSLG